MQNKVQLEFRNGDYLYLGIRISGVLQNIKDPEVQLLIQEKALIFDE